MLYVLKYVGNGPGDFLEHCYDESVVVKNYVALVQFEHNKNMLLGMNFEEVGTVESEDQLKDLFKSKDTVVEVRKEVVDDKPKVVPLDSILPKVEGQTKSWYENLE